MLQSFINDLIQPVFIILNLESLWLVKFSAGVAVLFVIFLLTDGYDYMYVCIITEHGGEKLIMLTKPLNLDPLNPTSIYSKTSIYHANTSFSFFSIYVLSKNMKSIVAFHLKIDILQQ